MALQFELLPVTPFMQNCTLLWDEQSRAAVLTDVGGEAERLLADSGWLPEPLRMPEVDPVLPIADTAADGEALPAFLGEDGDDGDEDEPGSAYAIAAE